MLNSSSLYEINNGIVPAMETEEHQFYYMDEGFKVGRSKFDRTDDRLAH